MGTEITLDLAGMTITYAKNHSGMDHGSLFQETDRRPYRSPQLNYDYFEKEGEDPTPNEMAFVRKLKDILPRLELLGFTRERARADYQEVIKVCREESSYDDDDDGEQKKPPDLLGFDEFCAFVAAHPVETLENDYHPDKTDEQHKGRFASDPVLDRIPEPSMHERDGYSERSYFGSIIGILHPYSLIRVLSESERNLETDIVWQYGPLVENGWAKAEEFVPCARRHETFLVATEGSSDVHILKRALQLIRPDILDFFRFIDVSDSHPFSGSSLAKFAEGLAKIDVQNQTVFVFDNDAEGYDACEKVKKFALPTNMRAILLPDLEEFRTFPAKGPQGVALADINQRAAAIECYLDLNFLGGSSPHIVWTNLKKDGIYQGALDNKEAHSKAFLKGAKNAIASGEYDVSKLRVVLDALVAECSSIAEGKLKGLSRQPP